MDISTGNISPNGDLTTEDNLASDLNMLGKETSLFEARILQIPAVQACIDLIAGSFAQCPLVLHRPNAEGHLEEVLNDRRLDLFNLDANQILKSDNLKKEIVRDYFLWGYSYIKPNYYENKSTIIRDLTYIPARFSFTKIKIIVEMLKTIDARIYLTFGDTGLYDFQSQSDFAPMVLQSEVISILKNTRNGVDSEGLIRSASIILNTALSELDYSQGIYNNASMPIGYLSSNQRLRGDTIRRIQESWRQAYSGSSNAFKVAILEEGLTYNSTALKPENLLLNDNRTNLLTSICQLFGVPPGMIDPSQESTTGNSMEQNDLRFVKFCLNPFVMNVANAINQRLLSPLEKDLGYRFSFDTQKVLQSTQKEVFEAVTLGLDSGLLTVNEARLQMGLPSMKNDLLRYNIGSMFFNDAEGRMIVPNSKIGISPASGSIMKHTLDEDQENALEKQEFTNKVLEEQANKSNSVANLNNTKAEAISNGEMSALTRGLQEINENVKQRIIERGKIKIE